MKRKIGAGTPSKTDEGRISIAIVKKLIGQIDPISTDQEFESFSESSGVNEDDLRKMIEYLQTRSGEWLRLTPDRRGVIARKTIKAYIRLYEEDISMIEALAEGQSWEEEGKKLVEVLQEEILEEGL